MDCLVRDQDYAATIELARQLPIADAAQTTTFHCYWNGQLNEKHLLSIQSCFYFNILKNKNNKKKQQQQNRIILWLENNLGDGAIARQIASEGMADVRQFSAAREFKHAGLRMNHQRQKPGQGIPFWADVVRMGLLHRYGGLWFDLDCVFLRPFAPLFAAFGDRPFAYAWENQPYPNNAILYSPSPESAELCEIIAFLLRNGRGFGFQQAQITYATKLPIRVLPCSWFDGAWLLPNPMGLGFNDFFKASKVAVTFETFFEGAFCLHWHNQWNAVPEQGSPFAQLQAEMASKIKHT